MVPAIINILILFGLSGSVPNFTKTQIWKVRKIGVKIKMSRFIHLSCYRFYSLMILVMGIILPLTLGVVSSASIAFVYKTSSFEMDNSHAMMWGVGQTVIHAFFGSFRLLATL